MALPDISETIVVEKVFVPVIVCVPERETDEATEFEAAVAAADAEAEWRANHEAEARTICPTYFRGRLSFRLTLGAITFRWIVPFPT